MKKNVKLLGLGSLALLVLSACGRGDVSSHSKGAWDQIVYAFAKAIEWLSFGGSVAIGIILFTIMQYNKYYIIINMESIFKNF